MAYMANKVIPLIDHRQALALPELKSQEPTGLLADSLGRPLRDLRISVTDRCNFRCSYCMPKQIFDKKYEFMPTCSASKKSPGWHGFLSPMGCKSCA